MNRRILVIDEDVETRRNLRDILQNAGWQVDDAPEGLEGLEMIHQAKAYGEGYNCIICGAFLTDVDGNLFLEVLRMQYPKVPLVVITSFGNAEIRQWCERLAPYIYLDKPYAEAELISSLDGFDLDASTVTSRHAEPMAETDPPVGAYFYVKFDPLAPADKLYAELRSLEGVISVNAIRGAGFHLMMRVGVGSIDEISSLIEKVNAHEGAEVIGHDKLRAPALGPEMAEFVSHYMQLTRELHADYVAGVDTNAYLMIDIDRYRLERIYLSILLTEGVIRCRAVSGFSKIIVLMAGAVQPNVVRHLLGKLAQMDGIRRVKEVAVVNMQG